MKCQSREVNDSQDVKITFVRTYYLKFNQTYLVKKGKPSSDHVDVTPYGVTLKNVQYYDSGTYQAYDVEGNLFLTLKLTVKWTPSGRLSKEGVNQWR